MRPPDHVGAFAQTTGDDDLAVLGERLADGVERFLHRRIDEAARVDDDDVGGLVRAHDVVTFNPQLREDAFGIDQRLRTTQTDETDFSRHVDRDLDSMRNIASLHLLVCRTEPKRGGTGRGRCSRGSIR